ncbi:MAG: sodium-dependent transporter [Nitrospinota bacterium]
MIRESWTSRLGIIMAVAGSAVGLGNFLRFPSQAIQNGGGAFMIPYTIALLVLAIPLCWVEWTIGRHGGSHGHGSGPGILNSFWNHPVARYAGILGIFIPLVIYMYYVYIESWCLAFSIFSLTGSLTDAAAQSDVAQFLSSYQGVTTSDWFSSISIAYSFFLITFTINFFFIYQGVAKGIEIISKIAMPLLVIIGLLLVVRILSLSPADYLNPDWSVAKGFGFFWNPDLSALLDAKVWLAATGQIFFTASVGLGVIITYASYLRKDDDITLSSLTSISINEFLEVVIGASIAIPAAYIFFGPEGAIQIGNSGAFNIGFVTMPEVFANIPFSGLFSFIWFFLLFLAGVTSSISMLQPGVSFLEDELGCSRKRSIIYLGIFTFIGGHIVIFLLDKGALDLFDFWGGTLAIVIFATIEVIIFGWVFGVDKGFKELHRGADLQVPLFFKIIIKYVTPLYLITILAVWFYQDAVNFIPNPSDPNFYYHLFILGSLATIFATIFFAVWLGERRGAFNKDYSKEQL